MLPVTHTSGKRIPFSKLLLPWEIAQHLCSHSWLIRQLTKREVQARYRGSYLGILGSLVRPLLMLVVYGVVFGCIFQSKLGNEATESRFDFVLALFCGIVVFDLFSDCLGRAATLVRSHPNYVTKVVFPLEVLVVSAMGAALIQLAISMVPLVAGLLLVHGSVPVTVLYLPLILVPLVLLCLGAGWFLASLGVFIRDVEYIMPVVLTVVMFASAIFYSINRVPPEFLPFFMCNPVAVIVDQARNAVLWGVAPAWPRYFAMLAIGLLVMGFGYAFFMRTKRAFADVM